MNVAEFIAKWSKVELKERSAAQEHFIDLCRVFEHPTPAEADPTGTSFCFEKGAAIAAAAKELNDLRENWLNPPEWTRTETLEFPGTIGGPWNRYIDPATVRLSPSTTHLPPLSLGTVRYPRLVARDAECAARLKDRTLTKLYNARPAWLADCHAKLDAAVAAAYGWPADLSDEDILERLLKLNLERAIVAQQNAGGTG